MEGGTSLPIKIHVSMSNYLSKELLYISVLFLDFSNSAWLFFKKSWNAVKYDEEMPTDDVEGLGFVDEVNFIEATSESVPQTCLNYLIGLVLFPLFFHFIESFCLYLPDPIPMLDFVLANKECCAGSDEHAKDDTEMREHAVSTSETHAQPNTSSIQWYEIGCCILAITYLILIPFCPKFFFPYSIEADNSTMYYCCPLLENNQTTCYSNSFPASVEPLLSFCLRGE